MTRPHLTSKHVDVVLKYEGVSAPQADAIRQALTRHVPGGVNAVCVRARIMHDDDGHMVVMAKLQQGLEATVVEEMIERVCIGQDVIMGVGA